MAWRYCEHCGGAQDQITLEDMEKLGYEDDRIRCEHCDKDRDDDTPNARVYLLAQEVIRLRGLIKP
jgi:hypothetical protein